VDGNRRTGKVENSKNTRGSGGDTTSGVPALPPEEGGMSVSVSVISFQGEEEWKKKKSSPCWDESSSGVIS